MPIVYYICVLTRVPAHGAVNRGRSRCAMVVSVSVNNLDTRDCISRLSDREGQHARSYAMGPHPLYRCTITRTYCVYEQPQRQGGPSESALWRLRGGWPSGRGRGRCMSSLWRGRHIDDPRLPDQLPSWIDDGGTRRVGIGGRSFDTRVQSGGSVRRGAHRSRTKW